MKPKIIKEDFNKSVPVSRNSDSVLSVNHFTLTARRNKYQIINWMADKLL
jgi:hypothetical protein